MPYALREETASKKAGCDVWYQFYTEIGPACTKDPKERALVREHDHWLQSKALRHPLCFFDIVELPEGCEGNYDWNKPAQAE